MDNCKEQLQSHVRANYVVGNEYSDLVNVITAIVPFIGYVRAANAVKILDEVVVAEGSVNSNSDGTIKTETKTEAKSDVKSENKEETSLDTQDTSSDNDAAKDDASSLDKDTKSEPGKLKAPQQNQILTPRKAIKKKRH